MFLIGNKISDRVSIDLALIRSSTLVLGVLCFVSFAIQQIINANDDLGADAEGADSDTESEGTTEDDGTLTDWNLRKCSAAALDVLASVFGSDLLPVLFPILQETLFHPEWIIKVKYIIFVSLIDSDLILTIPIVSRKVLSSHWEP